MSPLNRFFLSHGGNAFATGVHLVLLAWVAMQEMHLSATQWSMVQACALLPNLLLMPIAGAWADRFDPAKLIAAAQTLLTFAYGLLLLGLLLKAHHPGLLMLYAAMVGSGNAFVQPVREKLVADIPIASVQKRISMLSIVQFSLQSAGIAMAALSERIGLAPVVAFQVFISMIATGFFISLISSGNKVASSLHQTFEDIVGGVRYILIDKGLRQLMVLSAFNGYMHMGVFLVLIPIVATRTYQQNAAEYAILQLLFVAGMIVSHIRLHRQKMVEYPGQGALFSLLYTALVGYGLAKQPTPMGFYFLVFVWGLVAGNSAGRCRLVLQSLAKPHMKGRVMSVYQMMLFGVAPVGAIATGLSTVFLSQSQIFMFMSGASIALFVVFMLTRSLWSVRQQEPELKE